MRPGRPPFDPDARPAFFRSRPAPAGALPGALGVSLAPSTRMDCLGEAGRARRGHPRQGYRITGDAQACRPCTDRRDEMRALQVGPCGGGTGPRDRISRPRRRGFREARGALPGMPRSRARRWPPPGPLRNLPTLRVAIARGKSCASMAGWCGRCAGLLGETLTLGLVLGRTDGGHIRELQVGPYRRGWRDLPSLFVGTRPEEGRGIIGG